jgi:hypothetical protein
LKLSGAQEEITPNQSAPLKIKRIKNNAPKHSAISNKLTEGKHLLIKKRRISMEA